MPDISLWNKCNNRCIMCTNPAEYSKSDPSGNYDLKTQIKKIKMYLEGTQDVFYSNRNRKDYINITGGEPTIHPDFFYLIRYISESFKKIPVTLLTNGRRFADESFAKKFSSLSDERFTVAVSIHSYNPDLFDRITRIKKSFEQTISGIINLMRYFKGSIEIRTVIHALNINDLEKTIVFVRNLLIAHKKWYHVIIHYEIEGIGEKNIKKIELKLEQSASVIDKIERENFTLSNIRLYHFPLCVVAKDLRKYVWKTLPCEEIVFTEKCNKCKVRNKCPGLMKRYYEIYGDSELKTISR